MSIYYASQIKPYPGDIFLAIVHIYFMTELLSSKSKFSAKNYTLFCCFALLLSSISLIIITAFYLTWLAYISTEKRRELRSFFLSAGFLLIYLSVYYWLILRHQMSPTLKEFWRQEQAYIPVQDPAAAIKFIVGKIQDILQAALDLHIILLIILLLFSIITLVKKNALRFMVLFYLFLYIIAISLAALELYPLSGERTDSYLLPFNILFLCVGLRLVENFLPIRLMRMTLLLIPILLFVQYKHKDMKYPVPGDYYIGPLVKILERRVKQDDAIVCWSHAN